MNVLAGWNLVRCCLEYGCALWERDWEVFLRVRGGSEGGPKRVPKRSRAGSKEVPKRSRAGPWEYRESEMGQRAELYGSPDFMSNMLAFCMDVCQGKSAFGFKAQMPWLWEEASRESAVYWRPSAGWRCRSFGGAGPLTRKRAGWAFRLRIDFPAILYVCLFLRKSPLAICARCVLLVGVWRC